MYRFTVSSLIMFILSSVVIVANADNADRFSQHKEILNQIESIFKSPKKEKIAFNAGRERALLCAYCHGRDGNSLRSDVPNLAGQNPAFLLEQIQFYATGKRKDYVMQQLAKDMTEQDIVNLIVYYSSMPIKKGDKRYVLAKLGRKVYMENCFRCHGLDGRAPRGYAYIAGQQYKYLKISLSRYRKNSIATNPATSRKNSEMEEATIGLSDKQINALSAYIAEM